VAALARWHSPEYRELAARLRRAREEANLTQVEVAELIGRPQSFVAKIESAERRLDVLELAALAGIYKKPIAFFIPD
jgi:transcriptional regulator with XRE-family HTH domain